MLKFMAGCAGRQRDVGLNRTSFEHIAYGMGAELAAAARARSADEIASQIGTAVSQVLFQRLSCFTPPKHRAQLLPLAHNHHPAGRSMNTRVAK